MSWPFLLVSLAHYQSCHHNHAAASAALEPMSCGEETHTTAFFWEAEKAPRFHTRGEKTCLKTSLLEEKIFLTPRHFRNPDHEQVFYKLFFEQSPLSNRIWAPMGEITFYDIPART